VRQGPVPAATKHRPALTPASARTAFVGTTPPTVLDMSRYVPWRLCMHSAPTSGFAPFQMGGEGSKGTPATIETFGSSKCARQVSADHAGPAASTSAPGVRAKTKAVRLLLTAPELIALDLPRAGRDRQIYRGASIVPAINYMLSLLTLKLVAVRRFSHVDGLAADPGAGLVPCPSAPRSAPARTTSGNRPPCSVPLARRCWAPTRSPTPEGTSTWTSTPSCTGARTPTTTIG